MDGNLYLIRYEVSIEQVFRLNSRGEKRNAMAAEGIRYVYRENL